MRILVGVEEVAGLIPVFADGFRKVGHDAVTVIIKETNHFYPDIKYDIIVRSNFYEPKENTNRRALLVRGLMRINEKLVQARRNWLILSRDLFFFQNSFYSLLPEHRDFDSIRRLKKHLVFAFTGSDVRDRLAYLQWYGAYTAGREYLAEVPFFERPLAETLEHMRQAELYCDLILSVPNQSVLAVRPYMHLFIPVELAKYKFNVPGRDIPLVIHIPSNKDVKGTDIIVQTLRQLRDERIKFDFRILEHVPHERVVEELCQADIVIDEMYFPLHGVLTVEAMASGCAVATGNDEVYEPFPPHRPICSINPIIIKEQLRRLLTDKEWRIKLALEGRKYVERYHDHVRVAQRIMENLYPNEFTKYDHYPSFFTGSYRLPKGEVIPDSIKCMTSQIIQKWGLPADVDLQDLVQRGFAYRIIR